MNRVLALDSVHQHLHEWARDRGVATDSKGYVRSLDDNLFQSLCPDTLRDLAAGDGNELGRAGPTKLHALHSSAALACNTFDYWRGRPLAQLAAACAADPAVTSLRFEARYPTAAGGTPPNLDLELFGAHAVPTAIESKFLEPYRARPKPVKAYYTRRPVWQAVGLPHLADLAAIIAAGAEPFPTLDVAQLLAHLLGLATRHGRSVRLLYLWYQVADEVADRHALELERFRALLGTDVAFDHLTYQQLAERLSVTLGDGEHATYLTYLRQRYALGAGEASGDWDGAMPARLTLRRRR